jgi:hypothetical protein
LDELCCLSESRSEFSRKQNRTTRMTHSCDPKEPGHPD